MPQIAPKQSPEDADYLAAMTDDRLMLLFRSDNSEAFSELFRRYSNPVCNFFRRRLEDPSRAEELTQETFIVVLRGVERYEPRGTFRTYLYGIAMRMVMAERRKSVRRESSPIVEPNHSSDPCVDAAIWVRRAMEQLDAEDRDILLLREYEQLTYDEIAAVLHRCSSLADDFRALSQQLIAWTFEPAVLLEPSSQVDPVIQTVQDPQMVCAEFPDGLPTSYNVPRKRSEAHSLVWLPWVWAFAGSGTLVVILSVQFFRMSKTAPTLLASTQQLIQQDVSSLKDRLAQDEKANTDLQADLKAITDKLKITQGQLKKARMEAEKLNDETNQKVTALDTSVHSELATKPSSDDVKTVDTRVVGVRTGLDTTREDLKMAISEMGTLIARNHNEVNQLRRLGERDYTEFTINGRNRPQKVANVIIELEDVSEKRDRFNLAVTVEGKLYPKKDRSINEPIFFYTVGNRIPEEIVINKIGKDSVSGYVSVSKMVEGSASGHISSAVGKMIERTASLSLIVKELEAARAALEEIAKRYEGYFAELNTLGQPKAARTLTASMRVPAPELDSTLAELRKLGQLDEEKQGGEEVSQQYVDLKARLENSRHTEKRLTELLAKRADKLKDVLDVERELASTREEIERMDSEQRGMQQRVDYASIELNLREEYKPALNLGPPSAGTRIRNALVDGYHAVVENALGLVVLLFQSGPSILFWLALVFFPVRWTWRKLRSIIAQKQPLTGAV